MELSETVEQIKGISSNFEQLNKKINRLEQKFYNIEHLPARPYFGEAYSSEHKNAFDDYIRKGIESDLIKKSLSSDDGEAGSVIVPELNNRIISSIAAKSPMRQLASIEVISSNALDVVIEDGKFDCGWIGEVEARDETAAPKLKQKRIPVTELYAQPKASQRLVDDASISIESWLSERLSDSFVRAENEAFLKGDGNKKPKGLLTCVDIEALDGGGKVTSEILLELIGSLKEEYLAGASFLMNRRTLNCVQGLKDDSGRFIWQPSLTETLKQTIFGIPVVCASDMPDIGNGAPAIVLGDFKAGYKIVDRSNISIMRDPFTDKPFIKYYAIKRVGGDVINPDAMKVAKFS